MSGQATIADLPLGDSETAHLIRTSDWGRTALGPIEGWPLCLNTITAMMVRSTMPMAVIWGEDGIMLYNDAYAAVIGTKHPGLLGMPIREGWPEVETFTDHIMEAVLGGESLSYRDLELEIMRGDALQRIWANLDYSPLLDDLGTPAGILAIITETTERVLAERRLAIEHERLQSMFEQAPGFIALLEGPTHIFALTNKAYRHLLGSRDLIGRAVRDAVPEAIGQGFIGLLDTAYRTGKPFVGDGAKLALADERGEMADHYLDFVYQPVRDAAGAVTGIFVQGSDVTERVLSEQALRQSEDEYHRLNDALIRANDLLTSSTRPN